MFPSLAAFDYKGYKLFPNFFRDIFSSIPPDTDMHWVAPKWNWRLQTTVVAWLQSGSLPSRFLMFPSLAAFDYKGYKLFPNFFLTAFFMDPLDTGLHGTATISPHLDDLADNGSSPTSDHLFEGKDLANFHSLCSLAQGDQVLPHFLTAANTASSWQQIRS